MYLIRLDSKGQEIQGGGVEDMIASRFHYSTALVCALYVTAGTGRR
jgi:hypothetical protein